MSHPVEFDNTNRTFVAPLGLTEDEVRNLPARIGVDTSIDRVASVSCWQLSAEELAEVNANGGKVYLKIIGGQPAVAVTPFDPKEVVIVTKEQFDAVVRRTYDAEVAATLAAKSNE